MLADAKSLRFLGESKKLSVPFFQRGYVWGEDNWKELLSSFESDAVPFLGPIILKNITSPLQPEEKMIIDGQQRLTTITLLSKAIYDRLPNTDDKADSGVTTDVKALLFYKNNSSDKFQKSHVKIAHSRVDHEAYDSVIRAGLFQDAPTIDLDTINEHSSKIFQCYKFFMEQLAAKSVDELEKLHDRLFSSENKTLVVIELEVKDVNEQCIFDTINRAGIHLSAADIIKNNLFKQLLDVAGTDEAKRTEVISFYTENWEPVFNPSQTVMEIWDTKRRFGNVEHTNTEFLFYSVACIEWEADGDVFSELAAVYEKKTKDYSYNELYAFASEILEYAQIYMNRILKLKIKLEDESYNVYFRYKDGVNRLLLILEKFGVQMFYPFVLKRLYEVRGNLDDADLLTDFHVLESFVMRRKISPRGTNDYTAKCNLIIHHGINALIASDLGSENAQITDRDVTEYLHRTEDNSAKMILFWIELYKRQNERDYDVSHLEYKYTLEHIMPKKWEANWKNVPIIENGVTYEWDSEEGRKIRNLAIQQIGNKTLLTGPLNSTIKNSDFAKKINGDDQNGRRREGYRSHVSLSLTQSIVDRAANDTVWDEQHIEARTRELISDFLTLWPTFKERVSTSPDNAVSSANSGSVDPTGNRPVTVDDFSDAAFCDPIQMLQEYDTISGGDLSQQTNDEVPAPTTDYSLYNEFIDEVRSPKMFYSYKPLLIRAMMELADTNGAVELPRIVDYFVDYYDDRSRSGLVAENNDSAFVKHRGDKDQAKRTILMYPFKIYEERGMIKKDEERDVLFVIPEIWNSLSIEKRHEIIEMCDQNLKEYFDKLQLCSEAP